MKPVGPHHRGDPVPVWLFDEQQARAALAEMEALPPRKRDDARRMFHASFRRIV